jgi:DNA-nicking Smr family endonuclease
VSALTIDLHPYFRDQSKIDTVLLTTILKAAGTGATSLTIIHGNGSGQLRERVAKFLSQPHIRKRYRRFEHDPSNTGRIVVHFR